MKTQDEKNDTAPRATQTPGMEKYDYDGKPQATKTPVVSSQKKKHPSRCHHSSPRKTPFAAGKGLKMPPLSCTTVVTLLFISSPVPAAALPDDDAELFPLMFSIAMLVVAVLFSMWVLVRKMLCSSSQEEGEEPKVRIRQFASISSWVPRSIATQRLSPWRELTKVPKKSMMNSKSSPGSSCLRHQEDNDDMATSKPPPPKHFVDVLDQKNEASRAAHDGKTAAERKIKQGTLLSWSQVTCSYPGRKSSDPPFISLHDSFGEMHATELTVIMGGSGSGKSTLLDILSGRKTLGNITGKLSALGQVLDDVRAQAMEEGGALRSVAAYVPQREAFFPTQTAEEAVAFAANLKLGKDPRGNNVRWSRIQSVLRDVGLSPETCKRPIGGELAGGLVIRGLSGGERRRLAVACALALKPRLLFLDEITSGLDSENALAITRLLKRLCSSKKVAAMMVIHQPNGRLFREFDRLVLLSHGRSIFSDELSNLPDLYRVVFKTPMPEWYDLPSDLMTHVAKLSNESAQAMSDYSGELVATTPGPDGHSEQISPPSAIWKFRVVFQRNLTNHYVRNITNLACRLFMYAATSLVDGLLFWQVGNIDGETEISAVVGALTFVILMSYLSPFALIPLYVHDKHFYLAESALGLYSPWVYCLSQLILETWVIVVASTIEACIIIPMCGLWNPEIARWESFFIFLGALIVSGLSGSAMVLCNSMVLPSQDLAFMAGSGAVTISLALSGGFVPFPQIEDFISWVQWVSMCKYSLQALSLAFFQGTSYEELVNEIYAFDTPATVSGNMVILLAFFGVLAGGTVLAMSRQREIH